MAYLLVRHKVADFSKWKTVFDSQEDVRQKAGLRVLHLLRNIDDPSEVVLFFRADDLEKARAFLSAPVVPEIRRQSGVADKPDMYFLE